MLEPKLWYNKTESENAMVTEIVEFIKSCDQYPLKFNFGKFFNSEILPRFCWGKYIFRKLCLGEMGISSSL